MPLAAPAPAQGPAPPLGFVDDLAPLRIVIVGHVDHGKSTLIGRLLQDTGSLPDGRLDAVRLSCERRGVPFEWAFLMDAFKAERDQNITIDTTQVAFHSTRRRYRIIDAPGHREFLKNMVTGAAQADAAVLVIAADEGVREQSRRHALLLALLGVRQVSVVVNKMDRVGHAPAVFDAVAREIRAFLASLGVAPRFVIPVAARDGDHVVARSAAMPWYDGPTLVDALDAFEAPTAPEDAPLRLPIQDVYRFDHRRILAGRLESGRVAVGDTLRFEPGGRTARVASVEAWSAPARDGAGAGESVGITLDEQIFVERGQVAFRDGGPAPTVTTQLRARLFWMGRHPLEVGRLVKLKLATAEVPAALVAVERVIDASTLEVLDGAGRAIAKDDVAEVVLATRAPIALDDPERVPALGRFVLVDGYELSGGGVVLSAEAHAGLGLDLAPVAAHERALRRGHGGGVVWLAGGAERAALATGLERQLFDRGLEALVLDTALLDRALAEAPTRLAGLAATLAAQGLVAIVAAPAAPSAGALSGAPAAFVVAVGEGAAASPGDLRVDPGREGFGGAVERVLAAVLTPLRDASRAARAAAASAPTAPSAGPGAAPTSGGPPDGR